MAETKIEWTATVGADGVVHPGYTFNPWTGCQRVSPACDNCYAERTAARAPRSFGSWLPGGERKRTSESYWAQPDRWNRKARDLDVRLKVFCASMADVFDNAVPEDWRDDLWKVIQRTPDLDWLLLTKRPQLVRRMVPGWCAPESWPTNVWLGTTVENQAEADRRIPQLLAVPARVRFLSCEPLLGPLNLRGWFNHNTRGKEVMPDEASGQGLHWVIAGGESGPRFRTPDMQWFYSLMDQCAEARVPFFMKQTFGATKAAMPPIPDDLMVRAYPA
jgi:protein gp37